MVTGKLDCAGRITVDGGDDDGYTVELGILITFKTAEDLRAAIKDRECKITLFDE